MSNIVNDPLNISVRDPADRRRLVDRTQAPLLQASHLPGYFYESAEIFQREKEDIFLKEWLCVGRVEEVENPGDYLTLRIMDEPIVVACSGDGALNAFANVCRHRGVEVAAGRGTTTEFSCPYHGWLYDLTGKLVGAPYMKEAEGFDPANCRLTPLRIGVWAGWIFVTFDGDAPTLEEFIAAFDAELAMLQQGRCRLAATVTIEYESNWKLVVENLVDPYHSGVAHSETIGRLPKPTEPKEPVVNLLGNGGLTVFFDGSPMTPNGQSLFGKMPWLADAPESFGCTAHLAPNLQVFASCDNVHPVITWPRTPTTSYALAYILFPEGVFGEAEFDEKVEVYRDFLFAVLDEDRWVIDSQQRSHRAHTFQPGRMSAMEAPVHYVVNDYLERVGGDAGA